MTTNRLFSLVAAVAAITWPTSAQDVSASLDPPASDASAPSVDLDTNVTGDVTIEQSAAIQRLIAAMNVAPVEVNFDLAIGVEIPGSVTLTPLPAEVSALVPRFQGYLFFRLADGRIAIVSPTTLKIVLLLA